MTPAAIIVKGHLDQLPVIPAIGQKLIQSLESQDTHLDRMVADLAADPVLAARIVKAANSAYYAPSRPIDTVAGALRYLGFSQIRTIVIASTLSHVFTIPGPRLKVMWRESLATAVATKALAIATDESPEPAFLLGLTHRLGELILHLAEPGILEEIDAEQDLNPMLNRVTREHAQLGCSYLAVSAQLLRMWAFPSVFVHALEEDDALTRGVGTDAPSKLAALLHLARSPLGEPGEGTTAADCRRQLGLDEEHVRSAIAHAIAAAPSLEGL